MYLTKYFNLQLVFLLLIAFEGLREGNNVKTSRHIHGRKFQKSKCTAYDELNNPWLFLESVSIIILV